MTPATCHAVTGAFGYLGRYIAKQLLQNGIKVITLTNKPIQASPFGDQVKAFPFQFDQPEKLKEVLKGVEVLYNTYWIRFPMKGITYEQALRNTKILFQAAYEAGVKRIVHISITNPSEDSPYPYFRGKALAEKALKEVGLAWSILRPAVLFGGEDILINNIIWALRRFPVFFIFGKGSYKLQPIHVEDLAELAVQEGQKEANRVIHAPGPETFTFKGLVATLAKIIEKKRAIFPIPPALGYLGGWVVGKWHGDILLTWHEVKALMDNLLYVEAEPIGKIFLTQWVKKHKDTLGKAYHSELSRRSPNPLPSVNM